MRTQLDKAEMVTELYEAEVGPELEAELGKRDLGIFLKRMHVFSLLRCFPICPSKSPAFLMTIPIALWTYFFVSY